MFSLTQKAKLWIGGITTLVIIGLIFYSAWWVRGVLSDRDALETELEGQKLVSEYRATVIESRNQLLAAREKSAAANRAFLIRQAQSREALKNDAEINPDILGPDYFGSLQRPR